MDDDSKLPLAVFDPISSTVAPQAAPAATAAPPAPTAAAAAAPATPAPTAPPPGPPTPPGPALTLPTTAAAAPAATPPPPDEQPLVPQGPVSRAITDAYHQTTVARRPLRGVAANSTPGTFWSTMANAAPSAPLPLNPRAVRPVPGGSIAADPAIAAVGRYLTAPMGPPGASQPPPQPRRYLPTVSAATALTSNPLGSPAAPPPPPPQPLGPAPPELANFRGGATIGGRPVRIENGQVYPVQ